LAPVWTGTPGVNLKIKGELRLTDGMQMTIRELPVSRIHKVVNWAYKRSPVHEPAKCRSSCKASGYCPEPAFHLPATGRDGETPVRR
ncbi:hypothetical protein HAX54_045434, partial [Datura stramonium]|nr:hypothetical protein [Datura stramonium]